MPKGSFAVAVLVLVGAAACGGGRTEIAIDGSSTVFPVTQAVAEQYQQDHPGVQVTVGQSGTGGGFEKFCRGETDISNASRPIRDEEMQLCTENGVTPIEMAVAIDGLTVAVHTENDFVECLTVDQLRTIWEPGSSVETWSDIDPDWPGEQISFFAPGADSGTFDYFTEEIVGEGGAMRTGPDVQTSEDDNILIQGIANDPFALGYFGYAYYVENQGTLTAVAIDGGDGCVTPTDETIESGEYTPLSRPIFVYPKAEALSRPEVQAFVEFYLDNVSELVVDVGYIPVSEERLAEARQELEEATA